MEPWLFGILALAAAATMGHPMNDAPALPTAPQLFVDLERVENAHPSGRLKRMRNLERVFHAAQVHPHPVLRPEMPWEQHGFTHSVIYDQDERIFKMWYTAYYPRSKLCYATSQDGLHWERPRLRLHEWEGSRDNNIVIPPTHHEGLDHWESVLKDPFDPDPQRRYKALGWSSFDWDGPLAGIYTATSSDGLHWTHSPEPVFRFHPRPGSDDLGPVGDAHALMIDTLRQRYVAFLRALPHRSISVSDDFVHWTPPRPFLFTRHGEEEFYNNSGFVYGDQYLGLVSIFNLNPDDHTMHLELISSRGRAGPDGVMRWERAPAPAPFIACGGVGEWNRFMSWNNGSPPVRVGDRLYFYFRGSARRHGPYRGEDDTDATIDVGLAILRLDGFASLNASFDGGEVVTTAWRIEGGALVLNAKCDYGEIRAELLDPEGRPLPGYTLEECLPVVGDGVALPVRWREHADLSGAAGRVARLRFHLKNARLYSYRRNG